jgi:hypothetical protein
MTGWTARAIATELVEERVSGDADVDVTTAVLETLCARHARATPSDVVIGLNLEASDEHASTTTAAVTTSGGHSRAYTDEGKRLLKSYVVAFPSVVRAFEATAFVDVRDGSTRCSKFARGLDEETIAAVRDWRGKNLGAKLLALDADADVVVGGGARRAGGKKTREGGRKSNAARERGSREVRGAAQGGSRSRRRRPLFPPGVVRRARSQERRSPVLWCTPLERIERCLERVYETLWRESRVDFRIRRRGHREESATTKASVPQLPIITAELLAFRVEDDPSWISLAK